MARQKYRRDVAGGCIAAKCSAGGRGRSNRGCNRSEGFKSGDVLSSIWLPVFGRTENVYSNARTAARSEEMGSLIQIAFDFGAIGANGCGHLTGGPAWWREQCFNKS